MVEIGEQFLLANRDDWRAWLEKHHAIEKEIWLVLYKKHVRQPHLTYNDAVEEALCFGWIDNIGKRIDDEKFVLRFSPRKRGSIWAESNKRRVAKLIKQKLMTAAGLAAIKEAKKNGEWKKATLREVKIQIPAELAKALCTNKKASSNFARLAPSYKKQLIGWINSAKMDVTRQKRIQKTLQLLEENRRPGE